MSVRRLTGSSSLGRPAVSRDSASGQPESGDLGAPGRLGRVEGLGTLRPVVVDRDGELPPLQCLLASGVVGDDVVGQVLGVPVMRLPARGGERRGKHAQLVVQFRQEVLCRRRGACAVRVCPSGRSLPGSCRLCPSRARAFRQCRQGTGTAVMRQRTGARRAAGFSVISSIRQRACGQARTLKSNGASTRQATSATNGPRDDLRTTLVLLVEGNFRVDLTGTSVTLEKQGDYAAWGPGIDHSWEALSESVVITVRWPSSTA